MILKKYLISASAMAVLSTSVVPQVIANNELRNQEMIVKTEKESGVSISAPNKTIKKGDKFNPMTGVSAKDFDGSDITRHIIVTHNNVNVDRAGVYKVGYAVLGKNGKRVDIEVTITVVGESGDTFNTEIIAEDIVLKKGSKFNPMYGVKAVDVTGSDITQHVLVTKNNVDTKNIGKYEVTYLVLDTKGNRVYKTRVVEVKEDGDVSKKETIIVAEDKTIEKGTSFDPMKGVKAIDITGKDITQHVLVVENTVNPDKVSVGTVKYLVLDTEGNRVYKTIKVTVTNGDETPRTEIIAEDITLNTGDVFEEKKNVKALDITGKDITEYLLVTKNNVNTNKPGDYQVTYLVLDTEGNRVSKTITVHVVGEPIFTDEEKAQEVIDLIDKLKDINDIKLSDKDVIVSTREAYEQLSSEAKLLVSNLDKLEGAEAKIEELQLEVDKASAKDIEDRISALNKEVVYGDAQKIMNIRRDYDALNPQAKTFVTNLNVLEEIEDKLDVILTNVHHVMDLILVIPEELNITHKTQVEEARKAYEDLREIDKVDFPKDVLNILVQQERILNEIVNKFNNAVKLIEALPVDIELTHKTQVEEARNAYEALGDVDKSEVEVSLVEKLENAEFEIKKLEIINSNPEVQTVITDIEALPALDSISTADKDDIYDVMARFRALPDNVKFVVDATALFDAFNKVETLLAEEIDEEIINLPAYEYITLADKSTIEDLRNRYEALDDSNKEKVTNLYILELAEEKISILERLFGSATVENLIDKINTLPEVIDIQWSHEYDIKNVKYLYESLDSLDKDLVTNHDKLVAVEAEWNRINDGIDEVLTAIHKIPALEDITLGDKQVVVDARNTYNSHDKKVTYYIDKMTGKDLVNAEIRIEQLEKLEEDSVAKDLVERINVLSQKEITLDDKNEVLELRRIYNSLTPESQKAVINKHLLFGFEDKIAELEKNSIVTIEVVGFDSEIDA